MLIFQVFFMLPQVLSNRENSAAFLADVTFFLSRHSVFPPESALALTRTNLTFAVVSLANVGIIPLAHGFASCGHVFDDIEIISHSTKPPICFWLAIRLRES